MSAWENYRLFEFDGRLNSSGSKRTKRQVYFSGDGPPLLLMHELPGLSSDTFELADKYVAAGFQVYLPLLTGKVGDRKFGTLKLGVESLRLLCMSREINLLKKKSSSPITMWLRDLCNYIREDTNYRGVGVIGMCLTGNFALSLMADDSVLGAVSAQPSLPFAAHKALHMSDSEIRTTINRLDEMKHHIHAYRFEKDKICRAEKFETLNRTFNEAGRERIKLTQLSGIETDNPVHSVLVYSFQDGGEKTLQVLNETVEYFHQCFAGFG